MRTMTETKALLIQLKKIMLLNQLKVLNYRGCSKTDNRMKQTIEILMKLKKLEDKRTI